MLQETVEGKWVKAFVDVFRLCAVKPGEVVAILSESQTRPILTKLSELVQRQLGKLGEDRPCLRFREDRHHLAGLHRTETKDIDERLDPLAFDGFLQHRSLVPRFRSS